MPPDDRGIRGRPLRRAALLSFALTSVAAIPATARAQGAPSLALGVMAGAGGVATAGAVSIQATLGEPIVHAPSPASPSIAGGYWRTPLKDGDEIACGLLAGEGNVFHLTRRVTAAVEAAGPGTLRCLRVARTDAQHPQWQAGTDPSAYWTVTGFDASGQPAAGYSLALTFPHPGFANPFACRWGGAEWECAQTSWDAGTVTRGGVTALSDWVVADHALPVGLFSFEVE